MSSIIRSLFLRFPLTKRHIYACNCARQASSASKSSIGSIEQQQQASGSAPSSSPQLPNLSSPNDVFSTTANSVNTATNVYSQSTKDYKEIQYFEDVSNLTDWFDEINGTFKSLHAFNRVRVPWILAHFGKALKPDQSELPLAGKRILDVGCGAGILSLALCRLGAEVIGIDASEIAIEIASKARETLPPELRGNINFVSTSVEEYITDEKNIAAFHGIVASEVIEHVLDLRPFIRCICQLAKPNSPLFFTTINRTIWSNLIVKVLAEDVLKLLPKGIHDYNKFVTPEVLQKLLIDEQCSRIGPVLGLYFNPLFNYWSWTNFTEVNYALVAFTAKL